MLMNGHYRAETRGRSRRGGDGMGGAEDSQVGTEGAAVKKEV